jgi:CRISPR-associated exonuclease Cas4
MMGDKDYKQTINETLDILTKETVPRISEPTDSKTVFLHEVIRCMRRSYFDRFDSIDPVGRDFGGVLGGLIRKLPW